MSEPTYTAIEIGTFVASLGILISGIGAVIVNIIVALKQGKKVDEVIVAVAKVQSEAEVIKGHVNSAATDSKNKIEALESKIEMMTKTATDIKEALLLNTTPPSKTNSISDNPHLEKIELNTASIDVNTKKTTRDIATLKKEK